MMSVSIPEYVVKTWKGLPWDAHTMAFYRYLKRHEKDPVFIVKPFEFNNDRSINITIHEWTGLF